MVSPVDTSGTDTFLRVAEYWQYDAEAKSLSLVSRYSPNHPRELGASRDSAIPIGSGLIGRCALLNAPILSEGLPFNSDHPEQTGPTKRTVTLAIPWKANHGERGVLALFFAHSLERPSGGVEVWSRTGGSQRLGLFNAFHGIAEDFRRMSSLLFFEMGEGLPGRVVQHLSPEALRIAENTREFLRAVAAETSGFVEAVGFPVAAKSEAAVVLLGHREQPLAQQTDVWKMTKNGAFERCVETETESHKPPSVDLTPHLLNAAHSGAPVLFKVEKAGSTDFYGGLVLPFLSNDGTTSLCTMTW
jgi:hypothetical protein